MAPPLRFLVADPSPDIRRQVKDALTTRRQADVVEHWLSADVRTAITDSGPFDLVVVGQELPDEPGDQLSRWIRRDARSLWPNVPVVLMAESAGPEMEQVAVMAGARLMPKPFNQGKLVLLAEKMMTDYPNFIVSPSYFGPDRRHGKRPLGSERRMAQSATVQIIDDPADYAVGKDAIVLIFDYLKLRLANAPSATMRDFLLRAHLQRAADNIPLIQERLLGKVTEQQAMMDSDLSALMGGANGSTLKKMNRSAKTMMVDTTTAGFLLMASIATSLHHYTSGTYSISDKLLRFLTAHVTAIRSAIIYRIFDDGGSVGQSIVGALKVAESVFRRPAEA